MKKIALILLSLVLSNFAFADGHGHGNEFPFKYFLHNDITTDDAQATLAGTRAFVESGVFKDRGVAVGCVNDVNLKRQLVQSILVGG